MPAPREPGHGATRSVTIEKVHVGEIDADGFYHITATVAGHPMVAHVRRRASAMHGIEIKGEVIRSPTRTMANRYGQRIPFARTLNCSWGRLFERQLALYVNKHKLLLSEEQV